jgi:hypothetical protein
MKEETMDQWPVVPVNYLTKFKFHIPSYQRGYRWTENQVIDLLNDLLEFYKKDKGKEEYYCLQPIVLTKNGGEDELIVIDGQQRLTTIHIILSYLKDLLPLLGKKPFTLSYETRTGSESFLNEIDPDKRDENIDYYHIVEAYQTIKNWFEQQEDGSTRVHLLNTLLGNEGNIARVIWYELDETSKPIEVFTRLNMGKIGLTNAELIKALFLSTAHKMTDEEKKNIKHRQKEIASEWDHYEAQLRQEEFWGFLQNGAIDYENHIELIFDIMANNIAPDGKRKDQDKYFTFRFFSKRIKTIKNASDEWQQIKSNYQLLHDWFTDKRLYHLVGFLIAVGEKPTDLINQAKGLTKQQWLEHLRKLISNHISGNTKDVDDQIIIEDLETLTYEDDKSRLRKILLLFNILSILSNPKSNLRFQFARFKDENWDIEHIHSVKSEMPKAKAHQLEWLKEVESYTKDSKIKTQVSKYLKSPAKNREVDFEKLYDKIVAHYSEDKQRDINDLSNLTLLDSGTNRGYKNAVFPIKRKTIIEKDESGTFVPLCTKNVFLKYYNRNIEQTTFWGEEDRKTYKEALISTVKDYFNGNNY